jgi:predicted nucleic acid-binding protein
MSKRLLLDTDIVVDFLRGQPSAVAYVKAEADRISFSSIVVAELYAGVRNDELQRLDELLSLFPVIPVTADVARAAGLHKRDYFKSHVVGLADAIIAATAETLDVELKTFNVKHYPMLSGLQPPYSKP